MKLLPALLLAATLGGCADEPPPPPPAEPGAFVASAKGRIDIEGGLVRLAAQREGVIERVLVEEGDRVRPGQLLAVLGDAGPRRATDLARAETEQAGRARLPLLARLAGAGRELARLGPLAKQGLVPTQELDAARDTMAQLRAELALADAGVAVARAREAVAADEIEQRRVRAPAAGTVVRRQARPGDGVSVATVTPLFVFAPEAPLIVRAELEERWLREVQPGQRAEVVLEADDSQRLAARVLRLAPVMGQRTAGDDPAERQDLRVVECVLALEASQAGEVAPRIGQRVIVRFLRAER